jgi:hypothetical protein
MSNGLSKDDIGKLLTVVAFILGGWLRLHTAYHAGFPIGDGGLFYVMIRALQNNGYRLPEFVQYNGLNIPFAYPPLAFYLTGGLNSILKIPQLAVIQWFPAVVLTFSILPFHRLSKTLLKSEFTAGIATLFYAFLPSGVFYLIQGGGITRSLGQLFLILAITNIYLVFTQPARKYLLFAILFGSLVCISHPEAALHTIASASALWFLKARTRAGTINALIIAGGVAILTSLWWIPRVLTLGTAPYLSAAQTGLNSVSYIFRALVTPPSMESFLTIIALMAMVGIIIEIIRKNYTLPILYILPILIEPRGAATATSIFMAILASIAICDLVLPALSNLEGRFRQVQLDTPLQSRGVKILLAYLILNLFLGMYNFDMNIQNNTLSNENRQAFSWVQSHTPSDSRFIIVGANYDLTGEWFPLLAERISISTCQGQEWLGIRNHSSCMQTGSSINLCPFLSSPLTCIANTTQTSHINYNYIYIIRRAVPADWPKADNLIAEMEQHANYVLVYHTENVYIFAAPAANTTKENKEFTQAKYIKNAKVIHREWIL